MSPDGEALWSRPSHVRPSCALGRLHANAFSVMGQKLVTETEQGWVGTIWDGAEGVFEAVEWTGKEAPAWPERTEPRGNWGRG